MGSYNLWSMQVRPHQETRPGRLQERRSGREQVDRQKGPVRDYGRSANEKFLKLGRSFGRIELEVSASLAPRGVLAWPDRDGGASAARSPPWTQRIKNSTMVSDQVFAPQALIQACARTSPTRDCNGYPSVKLPIHIVDGSPRTMV